MLGATSDSAAWSDPTASRTAVMIRRRLALVFLRGSTADTLLSIGFRLERFAHVRNLILRNRQRYIQTTRKHECHQDHPRMIRRAPNVASIDLHDVSTRKIFRRGPSLLAGRYSSA